MSSSRHQGVGGGGGGTHVDSNQPQIIATFSSMVHIDDMDDMDDMDGIDDEFSGSLACWGFFGIIFWDSLAFLKGFFRNLS